MKILFVCLGNICRSPLAEGIFRHKVRAKQLDWKFDSAGTGDWHAGEHPDPRAIAAARKFGVDISDLVARQFSRSDFERFDRIFVMDSSNYRDVVAQAASDAHRSKVDLFLNVVSPGKDRSVPDPWYGGPDGFDSVFRMLDEACDRLIEQLNEKP